MHWRTCKFISIRYSTLFQEQTQFRLISCSYCHVCHKMHEHVLAITDRYLDILLLQIPEL